MTFTHYQKAGDKVFPVCPFPNPFERGPMCRDCADEDGTCPNRNGAYCDSDLAKPQYSAFETWLSMQPPIYADPSIKDGVYKVEELGIVKQHFFMGEWLVLDNNQVSAYIDRGLKHRIYATLKQPVKQEEKEVIELDINDFAISERDLEMAFAFGYVTNPENNCLDNKEMMRRYEVFKSQYLLPMLSRKHIID